MIDGATLVIELTPPGRAAVAVVLVAGPSATLAVNKCLSLKSGRQLQQIPIGKIVLGHWGGPVGEEVIACRRSEEQVEVHCHGGVAAVRAVVDRLVESGCRQTAWQDWIGTTESDPIRVAARLALAEAPTIRTAAVLLDQYNGALTAAIQNALDAVSSERWPNVVDQLERLLALRNLGLHLTSPWRVVIAGPPNVGKSSLLNALAGFQRAIVSPLAGTTRDVVTLNTAIDGWPVTLADTAGLRTPGDELEAAGVELAETAISDADLLLVVQDAALFGNRSGEPPRLPSERIAKRPALHVFNKIDLVPEWQLDESRSGSTDNTSPPVFTSAATGDGIAALVAAIGNALVPTPPPAGAAVPFTEPQLTALEHARAAISRDDVPAARAALQSLLSS